MSDLNSSFVGSSGQSSLPADQKTAQSTQFVYPESLDIKRLTPDSTVGSSKRFFTNSSSQSGENKEFSVEGLRDSRDSYRPFVSGTSRPFLADSLSKFGESKEFSVTEIEDSYDSNKSYTNRSLAETTRGAIGKMYLANDDPPKQNTFDSRHFPSKTRFNEAEPEKVGRCLPKLLLFLAVTVVVLAGIVVLVISQKDSKPDAQVGSIIADNPEEETDPVIGDCPEVEVKLRERINIICATSVLSQGDVAALLIIPPPYVNKGQNILVDLNSNNINDSEWTASLDIAGRLNLTGPLATCSSAGTYQLDIVDSQNTSLYSAESILMVKSEVLQVNVSLNQSISNSSKEFTVGCSTNSGCEQSFVDFFAEINKEEQYLRGVNFTCVIKYNDYDGYSVSCVGTIPDFLMSQFGKITCRPRSSLLDNYTAEEIEKLEQVLELPECDISKHCGYQCLEGGDYFVVNSGRCDIFHRCYRGTVFSEYCAPGTFFDPGQCACRHVTDLAWCQSNGALKQNLYQDIMPKECHTPDPS